MDYHQQRSRISSHRYILVPSKGPDWSNNTMSCILATSQNFGKQVTDWYWTRDSGIYIFAETPLDQQRRYELCQYFSIRGRTVFGTPADSNQDNTGTHGGMLVLADPASGLTPFEAYTNQGCGFQPSCITHSQVPHPLQQNGQCHGGLMLSSDCI